MTTSVMLRLGWVWGGNDQPVILKLGRELGLQWLQGETTLGLPFTQIDHRELPCLMKLSGDSAAPSSH